jgi:hypothetical protein
MDKLLQKLEQEYIGQYDCELRYILQEYSIIQIVNHIMEWLKIEWTENDNLNYAEITTIARDFYIGSNLTEQEKDDYYNELKVQGFFISLENNLYAEEFGKCSWTIYTFGKFSQIENSIYLEKAYEKLYADTNPILSKRCLNELQWLGSEKVEHYLAKLYKNNDIISKLTLLMYWESHCESDEIDNLLLDKELIKFISPHNEKPTKDEIIFNRLSSLENYIFKLHNDDKKLKLSIDGFEKIAKDFFTIFK